MRCVTFVDIYATFRNIRGKESPSFFANAESFIVFWLAVCVGAADDVFARCFARKSRRGADKSGIALTFIRTRNIKAVRTFTANIWSCSAFIDV